MKLIAGIILFSIPYLFLFGIIIWQTIDAIQKGNSHIPITIFGGLAIIVICVIFGSKWIKEELNL